ncbi:hypothetical protein ACF09L_19310 [Streptomyces sp. NPDC014779]|uniref:hypothetical protein n=1 Tax=Streptomyces sp. NPDC014779 TaxID=3364911 RepID=UPI0036F93A19
MTAPAEPRQLPRYADLTWDQHLGRNCIWCDQLIRSGGYEVGRVEMTLGAHHLATTVYAGPCCPREETS